MEFCVVDGEFGVLLEHRRGERAKFGERLDSRKSATNNGHREKAIALLALGQVRCFSKIIDNSVADGDCLFNGLHPNCFVGHSRNRERA